VSEEHTWNAARLIPTSGINGPEEQERRATSALLAVMASVKEFGRALTTPLGASAGTLATFIEVPFKLGDAKVYPDGLIQVTRAQKTWTALVEVKTGDNDLATLQLENYLDVARENGFDALITISNQIPPAPGQHPTPVDNRKLRKVSLHHWSWSEVLTQAVMQKEFHGVADPDQAWILGELIRYLEHPRSGALSFHDMGTNWVGLRDSVVSGTIRRTDKGAAEVANRFDALVNFAGLRLGRKLGAQVTPALTKEDAANPAVRTATLVESLIAHGTMTAGLRIPNAVAPLIVEANLRSNQVTCHFEIPAPKEGRPTTRINWLLRQLKDAPGTVRVEAFASRSREGAAALLKDARLDASKLVVDPSKEIVRFRIAQIQPLGPKRGLGAGSFIDSVLTSIDGVYGDIGQMLKLWTPSAPKLRDVNEVEADPSVASDLVSTAMSSQDSELPPLTDAAPAAFEADAE
jgi:hypothetical protein